MNKVIRDGKVAVLYSPGYGAGWYSWRQGGTKDEAMLFHHELVAAVESGDKLSTERTAARLFPDQYLGGVAQLTIAWVPQGTQFSIDEYDGNESLSYRDSDHWVTA